MKAWERSRIKLGMSAANPGAGYVPDVRGLRRAGQKQANLARERNAPSSETQRATLQEQLGKLARQRLEHALQYKVRNA